MIDDVIMHCTWRICTKKKRAKPDLIGLLPTNHFIAYITMEYTGVCEETFDIHSRIAQTTQNFIVGKSNLQEMVNLGDYPGDFRL